MTEYTPLLLKTALFIGFTPGQLQQLLPTLHPVTRQYSKGDSLILAGYETHEISIVLTGVVEAVKETRTGGQFFAARMRPGSIFGDVLAGSHTKSPVTVRATSPCHTLCFALPTLLAAQEANTELHHRLLTNLVALIADKYFALDKRVDLLLLHGLQKRIAAYLLGEADAAHSHTFAIPFNRLELAGYLGCERSALSRELSRMARQGYFQTNKKQFTILQPQAMQALLC